MIQRCKRGRGHKSIGDREPVCVGCDAGDGRVCDTPPTLLIFLVHTFHFRHRLITVCTARSLCHGTEGGRHDRRAVPHAASLLQQSQVYEGLRNMDEVLLTLIAYGTCQDKFVPKRVAT